MEPIPLLLVEDNADDAALIASKLRRGGLNVDCQQVETPAQMAAALQARPPALVISDCKMPSFDAQEALELLHDSGLDVPFIVVSGQIGEETAAALMRAGAKDFVLKDSLARLVPAVQRELDEARDRQEGRRAQAALRTSEERFRLLAEHIQDVVFRHRLRPDPQLEYLSPMASSMLGCVLEER
jgi:DNA-binding NtrC family response regulator